MKTALFLPFSQLRDGDFRRPGVSFPLGGSSDPLHPHSRAAITTGRRERAAVRPRPARECAQETSVSEGMRGIAPRGTWSLKFCPLPPHSHAGDQLFLFWERQAAFSPGAAGDPTASCCCGCQLPVLPTHPTRGGLRGCACERQHQQQILLAQKTCNAAAKGRGVGVGANAKQRRRQQQPPPPPAPPPLPREAAERLQLHLQQQPASPPPGAPLDLGREQPRRQLETKINSPHPKLRAQRAETQPGAPDPPRRTAPAHPGSLQGPASP